MKSGSIFEEQTAARLNSADKICFLYRLLAVPFWLVERAREIAERKTGARRKKREETGGEAGRKGTAVLAVTDAFEFPIAPASLTSNWLLRTFGCQSIAQISYHITRWLRSRKKVTAMFS